MVLTQNTAAIVSIVMRWKFDHTYPLNDRTVTIRLVKNETTTLAVDRTVVGLGFGVYAIHLLPEDTSDLGDLLIICDASGASTKVVNATVVPSKLDQIINLPLSELPTNTTTIGGYVSKVLLTVPKYLGLMKIK
jgi:hypothetical protein